MAYIFNLEIIIIKQPQFWLSTKLFTITTNNCSRHQSFINHIAFFLLRILFIHSNVFPVPQATFLVAMYFIIVFIDREIRGENATDNHFPTNLFSYFSLRFNHSSK